ncbi:MAG: hypothetical protein HY348_04255 [Nitrospira defluvii]|nr:hypothetical protein [Nitrospira defluvii]
MLISLHSYPRVDQVTVFLVVLVVCYLPSLADIAFCHELSPVALPSEIFADGEERAPSEPLVGSDSSQDCALNHQLLSSLETFDHSAPTGKDPAAQGASRMTLLYRLTPRPPPSIR